MDRKEAINALKFINLKSVHPFLSWEEMLEVRNMAIEALQEPNLSYEEIMVGDIIKNFGCEYEVDVISHIEDELFISAYRIGGEEE